MHLWNVGLLRDYTALYCLHHQGYHLDDGGSAHLSNIGLLQTDYTALHQGDDTDDRGMHLWNVGLVNETTRRYMPERSHLHTRRRENLKSHTLIQFTSYHFIQE
jgi:hypothetical protein